MTNWQPIETVEPGTTVILFCPSFVSRSVFEAKAYPDGQYFDPTYSEWEGSGATHWQPLPYPPVQS